MALTREEKLERRRQHYLANRERMLAEAAEYRAKNPDKVKAAHQRWYAQNSAADARERYRADPERSLAAARKWKAKNPNYHRQHALARYHGDVEAGRARCREYRSRDAERHRQRCRDWIRVNPEKGRAKAHRYRDRKIGATTEVFADLEIFERDGWKCYICHTDVVADVAAIAPNRAVLDHIIALSKGGAHSRANTACACFPCNTMKGAHLTPEQTRDRLRLTGSSNASSTADVQAAQCSHQAASKR